MKNRTRLLMAAFAVAASSAFAHDLPTEAKIMSKMHIHGDTWYFKVRGGAAIPRGAEYACDFYVGSDIVASDSMYARETTVESMTVQYMDAKSVDAVVCYRA